MTDRYTKAIEQLGSDKLDVRIGGIYALERMARDSAKDHPTVMEVLTAFIREHSREPWPPIDADSRGNKNDRPGPTSRRPSPWPGAGMQSATSCLLTSPARTSPRANLARADLAGADLTARTSPARTSPTRDLAGADLADARTSPARTSRGATLAGAHLTGADLAGADLTRRAHLRDLTARTSPARTSPTRPRRREPRRRGPRRRDLARTSSAQTSRREPRRADLTASEWPEGTGPGRLDGRQRFRPAEARRPVIRGNRPLPLITRRPSSRAWP